MRKGHPGGGGGEVASVRAGPDRPGTDRAPVGGGSPHDVLAAHMRRRRLKRSRQRDAVVEVFLATAGHVSVEELSALVRSHDATVGQTTVYRALNLLVDCGLAIPHHFGDGQTRFERAQPGGHHDHLICTRCGAIEEFEDPEIERLQAAAARRHGFVLEGHVFELHGRCRACRGPARGPA